MADESKKKRFKVLLRVLKGKYVVGKKVKTSGVYECSLCENYTAFKKGEIFTRCEDCINTRKDEENSWYVTNAVVHFISKNLNLEFDRISSLETKLAVKITEFAGTMKFVYIHIIWFVLWVFANNGQFGPKYMFDPFPYGLLTMIVSLEAIFLSTIIMIGQNIMSRQSELRSELDYDVNLKTEKEVAEMSALLREIKEEQTSIKETLLRVNEDKNKDEINKLIEWRKKRNKRNNMRKKRKKATALAGTDIYIMNEGNKEQE